MLKIPFVDLKREANFFKKELIRVTQEVIISGNYIGGNNVIKLEEELANYCGTKYAVTVGNGSDALVFAMRALGIRKGDEVICPSNSFIASAWAIEAVGAKPVFCDVEDDLLISIEQIKKCISVNTRAILAVHLTGKLCNVEPLIDFCEENNIFLLEDAAQAMGAEDNIGRRAGSFGVAAGFSMHPLKNFAVYGDGGFLTTNSEEIAKEVKLLRNHGLINRDAAIKWGFNSRLDSLQAAYALVKIKKLEELTVKYIEIANLYSQNLTNKLKKPTTRKGCRDVFHNYVVSVDPQIRNLVMKRLLDYGIETKIHYPIPLHLQDCARSLGYKPGDIPNTERLAKSMISLPIYPFLEREEIDHVIYFLNKVVFEILGKE